ncbi:SHOCT domain-containing protein [Microbacterium deminutum]|uniref:SHOCT domain-containing protein n=1 Tax=Microbacterium deminutum TaxID=344164 RepID=A0ABN2QSH8_9MICO
MMRRMGRPGLVGLAARTAVVAGTATAVSGAVRGHQQNKAEQEYNAQQYEASQQQAAMNAAAAQAVANAQAQQAAAAPPPAPAGTDVVAELQKLAALHEAGVLTSDEFALAKAKLLS